MHMCGGICILGLNMQVCFYVGTKQVHCMYNILQFSSVPVLMK